MNALDWELARQKLLDSGVVNFTDGDIIDVWHATVAQKAKEAEAAAKAASDAAAAVLVPSPVVEAPQIEVVASYRPQKKNKYRGEVA